jgi:hypothetical protein
MITDRGFIAAAGGSPMDFSGDSGGLKPHRSSFGQGEIQDGDALHIIGAGEKSVEYFPSVNYVTHLDRCRELFSRAWSALDTNYQPAFLRGEPS